jgi:hypothetical protein
LTSDPIGLAGGINLFTYVLNNSINLVDPLGLEAGVLPGPLPLPIVLPKTDAQKEADIKLSEDIHDAWMEYVHDPIIKAGDLLYEGGIGEWVYDKFNPPVNEMGKGERGWEKGRGDDPLY